MPAATTLKPDVSKQVVVIADTHNHPHGRDPKRLQETLTAFEWGYKVASTRGIKTVVHLGDVYQDRSFIDIRVFDSTYDIVSRYRDAHGIKTVFVLGNHDMYYRTRSSHTSIRSLESLGAVVLEPSTIELAGRKVDVLPYCEDPMARLKEHFPEPSGNLLLFHAAIDGAVMSMRSGSRRGTAAGESEDMAEEEISESINPDALCRWKLALGGHYHFPQVVAKGSDWRVEYCGSTIQHSFAEAGERKRLLVLDVENLQYEEIVNDFSPRFEVIDLEGNAECDLPAPSEYANCRVKIILGAEGTTRNMRTFRQELLDAGALSVKVTKGKTVSGSDLARRTQIANASSLAQDPLRMVKLYVKLQAPAELDHAKLMSIGHGIVEQADAKLLKPTSR